MGSQKHREAETHIAGRQRQRYVDDDDEVDDMMSVLLYVNEHGPSLSLLLKSDIARSARSVLRHSTPWTSR